MGNKEIIMTKHASERLLERNIPLKLIVKMLERGIKLKEKDSGAMLCVISRT